MAILFIFREPRRAYALFKECRGAGSLEPLDDAVFEHFVDMDFTELGRQLRRITEEVAKLETEATQPDGATPGKREAPGT
jgi:hypothetical protein